MDRVGLDYKKSLISCFISYLKSVDILNKDYPNPDAPVRYCAKLIECMKNFDYESMDLFKEHGLDAECMAEELGKRKMKEYNMLELIYEASETMTEDEKAEKMKQARAKAEEVTEEAVSFCSAKAHYSSRRQQRQRCHRQLLCSKVRSGQQIDRLKSAQGHFESTRR
jgi:hypothetical protein